MKKANDWFVELVLNMYSRFFKTKKTKEIRIFISSMLFVFVATGISKGLWFIMNIFGGRVLGESLYGEYNLLISVAIFLTLPLGFGVIGGVLKTLAETDKEKKRKIIISTATTYTAISFVIIGIIMFLFHKQIAEIARIGSNLFLLAVILSIIWVANNLYEEILKGLHRQKTWSWIKIITHTIAMLAFIFIFLTNSKDILILYIPLIIIYALFAIIGFFTVKKYYSINLFDKNEFKEMFHFGIYTFIIVISSTFLGNVDKFMLNYFLGAESVGIYSAYYFASINLIGVIMGVFFTVFFPTAIKLKDPKGLLKKLDKLMIFLIPSSVVVVPVIIYIVIKYLYNYPVFITTTGLFALATILNMLMSMYMILLNAQGTKNIKRTAIGLTLTFILNIPLNYIFIPLWEVNGAIIASSISFTFLFIYVRLFLRKITSSKNK